MCCTTMVGDPGGHAQTSSKGGGSRETGVHSPLFHTQAQLVVCRWRGLTTPRGRRGPSRPWPLLCEGGGEHSRAAVLVTGSSVACQGHLQLLTQKAKYQENDEALTPEDLFGQHWG